MIEKNNLSTKEPDKTEPVILLVVLLNEGQDQQKQSVGVRRLLLPVIVTVAQCSRLKVMVTSGVLSVHIFVLFMSGCLLLNKYLPCYMSRNTLLKFGLNFVFNFKF